MKTLVSFFTFMLLQFFTIQVNAADYPHSGVAVMYHRFGENDYPTTNIRMEQLDAHIKELKSGKYNVMRLEDMVKSLQAGKALPDRSVAITIDDAFKSVYEKGWPAFRDAGLPVTLFVSTGPIDEGQTDYVSWAQLKQMAEEGLDIGGHTVNHAHLADLDSAQAFNEMRQNRDRLTELTGKSPSLFAYPYGEANADLLKEAREIGYLAAFGQHSGAMTKEHNQFYLPRFPVNENYGEISRFKTSINAIGLPATDLLPEDPFVALDGPNNPPSMGFTLPMTMKNTNSLACYHSKEGKVENLQHVGQFRIELRFKEKFTAGRTRINCTLPADQGRWYWYGMQFYAH